MTSISGDEVTGNYFVDSLGVQPEAGRIFHEADENGPGSAPYVVLSDALWRSAFHADPAIVGATVDLDKHPFTSGGCGARTVPRHGAVWVAGLLDAHGKTEEQVEGSDYLHSRTSITVTVIGRLKPGVTASRATWKI